MDTLKLIIVEDIVDTQEALKAFINNNFKEIEVAGIADSVQKSIELISELKPNIVLMDIQIFGGTSLDVLDYYLKKGEIDFEVIFITAFGSEYATKALNYSALDFINKPLDLEDAKDKLMIALSKARRISDKRLYNEQLKLLIQYFSENHEKNKRIALHLVKGIIQFVDIEQIVMLQTFDNLTKLALADGRKLTSVKPIAYFSNLLNLEHGFFRLSQSLIINTIYIEKFNPTDKYVILTNGEQIEASRRGSKAFKDYITENDKLIHLRPKTNVLELIFSKFFNRK